MQNRIYLKILLSFLIVASFYTLIITVSVVRSTYIKQRTDTINQIKSNLQQEATIIDQQLSTGNDAVLTLGNKPSIQRLALNQPNNFHTYAAVYDDIIANPDYTNYSSDYTIGVARRYNGQIISSSGYYKFHSYLDYMQIANLNAQVRSFFTDPPDSGIRVVENAQYVLLLRSATISGASRPVVFLLTWSKANLSPLKIYNNKGQLTLVDTLDAHSAKQLPGAKKIMATLTTHPEKSSVVIQRQQNSNQVFIRQSTVIPTVLFTYKISNRALSRIPTNLVQTLVAYFCLLLLVGGLLVIILSRRSFRPYAKIIDEVEQIDSNVRPQNAEILLEKIHDLVESNYQYVQMQHDVTNDLKSLFLKNLLLNSYSQKDITRFADILSLTELQDGGVIAIISFHQIAVSEEPLGINERKDSRKQSIRDTWPTPIHYLFDIDVNHYAIISEGGLNATKAFIQTVQDVTDKLSARLETQVHSLISVPFKTLYQIPQRFADAYSLATATPQAHQTSAANLVMITSNYTIETEAALIGEVTRRNFDKASQLLTDALTKNLAVDDPTLAILTNIKFVFLNTLKRTLDSASISVADFIDENQATFTRLNLETTPARIQEALTELFQQAFIKIKQHSKNDRSLVEHIIDYISRRYTSDLALSEIADHYHLSESHTSRLIKEHLGISFKDYLIQLRIRQAKSLLMESDQKVSDIAEQVGYKNVNTFIRVFKNATGQTPGKFRRAGNQAGE
ncbi:helix-turn-helix transcriptional regulator [Lacticaseibacillus sp. GG6-2]